MNQNFYNSNFSGLDQFQPPQYPVIHPPPQETSVEMLQAREVLMEYIQTFLKEFDCIPLGERPLDLLLAHERFSEIKQAFREEQHQPEIIQELLCKLLNDLQILNGILLERGEHAAQIITPSWKCPVFDDDDEYSIQYREYLENSSNAITPDLPNKELDNSLSMGDELLSTISKTESDEVIKSSVKNLIPILKLFSDFNDDSTLSDDDSFKDIDYIEASPPDSEFVSLEEVKEDILREKLLYINLLIAKIESLNNNFTPDCVLKSPSPFHIPVEDNDSFFEKSDTSLSYSDNSLPEFETFIDHTKETSSGSTITHADNTLLEYGSFLFEIEPDQG
nr:hypothetical protein [Tanacetum cinerariifolium]